MKNLKGQLATKCTMQKDDRADFSEFSTSRTCGGGRGKAQTKSTQSRTRRTGVKFMYSLIDWFIYAAAEASANKVSEIKTTIK